MNSSGTNGSICAETVPAIRKSLDALRAKHGADTPIGHRCSNLIEQLKNRETAAPDLRRDLDKFISRSLAELSQLDADHHQPPQGDR